MAEIVATDVVTLLQDPPPAASVSDDVAPGQTVVVPLIEPALGNGDTVNEVVAAAVPQPLVTV